MPRPDAIFVRRSSSERPGRRHSSHEFLLTQTRSPAHSADSRCTRRRVLRGAQPPATSERRPVSTLRQRLREPRQQRSYTAASPRPTRAGRGSVHHRAPASRRRPTRAAQRRRYGPLPMWPAHRAIPRAVTRRQAAVTTARSSRPRSRLTQSQSAAFLPRGFALLRELLVVRLRMSTRRTRTGRCRHRGLERGDSFYQPETREGANGIRPDAPEPDGLRQSKPLPGAPANCDHRQHSSDKE
jgi:hypothetical protein